MIKPNPIQKITAKKRRRKQVILKKYKNNTNIFAKKSSIWKSPVMIMLFVMAGMMLIIPTTIVMLPGKKATWSTESVDVFQQTDEKKEEIEIPSIDVSVKRSDSGDIEKIPLEKYVTSVVAAEMPAEFELEALKAQAVAARTYIVNHVLHQKENEVVISDTTEHQVYQNENELKQSWGEDFHWKIAKVKQAAEETKNEIITYEEQPITPTFFSMSNGYTEDAENYWGNELPYLKSVESKWETDNPKFTEQYIFTLEEMNNKIGMNLSPGSHIPIQLKRTASNRVSEMNLDGSTFSGREIREKLGLRSSDFTVQQKNNHFIFTTKGYGHGVGMSQYGANGMAEEGKTYDEIIQYYYQGVEITTITEAAPALVAK